MSIPSSSRYSQGTVVRIPDSNGNYQLSVLRTVPGQAQGYRLYTWKQGDRPDLVAYTQLGDPTLWWAVFDINPELINPLDIPPGTLVRVPTAPVIGQGTLLQ